MFLVRKTIKDTDMDIFNKILVLFFIFSTLNIIRHSFFLLRSFNNDEKFVLGNTKLFLLGISLSYFLMSIITGITI
jgi:hypothetical protein